MYAGDLLLAVGDVIIHHNDDALVRDPVGVQNLVGMANISLQHTGDGVTKTTRTSFR